jgi:hypothetical protein
MGTGRFRPPFGRVNLQPPFRFGQAFAWRLQSGAQNWGHFPLCSVQPGEHGLRQMCLRPDVRCALGHFVGHG